MGKTLLLFLLLFFTVEILPAQTVNDESAVLKLCVDLPELQSFYKSEHLYVMYHGITFMSQVEVFHNGNKVNFYDKQGINSLGIKDFFLFWQFYLNDNTAKVIGQYVMNYSGDFDETIPFELTFAKESGSWRITDSQINSPKN